MIGSKKPNWQSSVLSVGTAIVTAPIAAALALIIWRKLGPTLGFGAFFLIFAILAVAFYVLWMWVFFEHPAEIAKKLPISSKELHRKKKEFFDNLPK
jgi:hypothetical protein